MSIINFDEISKAGGAFNPDAPAENPTQAPYGGMAQLITVKRCQAKLCYEDHLKTADMFGEISRLTDELTQKAGVTEPLFATPELVQMLGCRINELVFLFSQAYGHTITILNSDMGENPYYSVTLNIEEKERPFPQQAASFIPTVNLYRINKGKCEVLKSTGWERATWRDYVGLTKEQWADVNKDDFLNEMMTAVSTLVEEPSNSLWNSIKKVNEPLRQLCDIDPLVYQFVSVAVAGNDEDTGLPTLLLVPVCRARKGVAIGVRDGRLVLFLKGHTLCPVEEFDDAFEAAEFIKNYYNKHDSGRTSVTLPLSKEKVVQIEDLRNFSIYDFDALISSSFPEESLTVNEKNMLHAVKMTLVDTLTDMQLEGGLITALLSHRRGVIDDAFRGLEDLFE